MLEEARQGASAIYLQVGGQSHLITILLAERKATGGCPSVPPPLKRPSPVGGLEELDGKEGASALVIVPF